jgi:hypothetical protein
VSVNIKIDRYSPEDTVFRAVAETLRDLSASHQVVGRDELGDALARNIVRWVEPF